MKTLIQKAVLVLVLAMVAQAEAQANEATTSRTHNSSSSIELVPNIGVNSFRLVNSDMDLSNRGGVSAGVLTDFSTPVAGLLFETGLDYFEAGGKSSNLFSSVEIELSYLAIPLKAKYEFYENGSYKYYGKAGVIAAAMMSSKAKADFFGATAETDLKDQTNNFDLLAAVTLGGDMEVGSGRVGLELEYDKGTQKTFKNQNDKLEGYTLRLGYVISI